MKRLLQISLDTLLASTLPIIMWLLLGFIIDKDISNVFSLTYPLQFLYAIFVTLFAIGPNITSKKEMNDNIVYSNALFGAILIGIVTIVLCFKIDSYIELLNISSNNIYHSFCIYSVSLLYFNFILQLILQKLYYDEENKKANKVSLLFSLTNFILIIILSIFTDYNIAIIMTLIIDLLIMLYLFIKNMKKFNFILRIKDNIKYTSFGLLKHISFLFIYGIGFGNSFSYGEKYLKVITFDGLTTGTQWDMLDSVDTASKIDITENKLDYKKSLIDSYKLLALLIGSILIMDITLYWYYKPDLLLLLIVLSIQIVNMLIEPIKTIKLNYLQINDNSNKHNFEYLISRIVRLLCSFIPSAFCTYIGQVFSMIYLYLYTKIKCRNIKAFDIRKR